jgi:hypothetical protein
MAYQIYEFDDVQLPLYNTVQTHAPGETQQSIRPSIGGAYNYYGTGQLIPTSVMMDISGWYIGELYTEVDEDGDYTVDESGVYIVGHDSATDVRIKVEAIQSKIGVWGKLWRRWISDTTELQWKDARLINVPLPHSFEDGCQEANVTCMFETAMSSWRAETQSSNSVAVGSSAPAGLTVHNGGSMRVDDAIIQITASSAITSVTIINVDAGISLAYTGTISAGQTLTIDCGLSTVIRSTTSNQYSGFALGAAHTARGWCPLAVGNNIFTVTANAAGTATIRHYNQWA